MNSLRKSPGSSLAALDNADLDQVTGGGASWGTCAMDALAWGGGAAIGGSKGGVVGAGLGFLGGAAASIATDPNCWDGQNSMASSAGQSLDSWFSGGGGSDVNDNSYTAAGDYTGY